MSKIIDAEDILNEARNCVECIYMAASDLSHEQVDPVQVVADIASMARTKPTTLTGAAALVAYTRRDLMDAPDPDWPMVALKTVAVALVRLTQPKTIAFAS